MSSASSSTAGSNAATANQNGQQAGAAGGSGSGPDNSHNGSAVENGAEGNVVQPQQAGTDGGGTAEPPTTSSATSHHRGGPAASGTTGSMATVLRRKTNVCLICGIYTNLSLNIFEPRNGPNIVDVIYEKYKFRAERGNNADKHICFSCNNWLINWYSLQSTSSGSSNRAYEPAPSTSRSSSAAGADSSNNRHRERHHQSHKSRTKGYRGSTCTVKTYPPSDKENCPATADDCAEQHNQVSSTTAFPGGDEVAGYVGAPYRRQNYSYPKRPCRASPFFRRTALRESNGHRMLLQRTDIIKRMTEDSVAVVSSSTEQQLFDPYEMLVKPFESHLIRMLECQGTSVTKECLQHDHGEEGSQANRKGTRWHPVSNELEGCRNNRRNLTQMRSGPNAHRNTTVGSPIDPILVVNGQGPGEDQDAANNEIVLSFDSAISEVIDVLPSLNAIETCSPNRFPCSGNISEDGVHSVPDPVGPLRQRLSSGVLSMSIIHLPKSINL